MSKNPQKDQELNLNDDNTIVEFLEKNLTQLLVDTAQMRVELDKLEEQKKQLLDQYSYLAHATLAPPPEDMDLLPRLNQVTSNAEELMGQLTRLMDAKAIVDQTPDQHCQEAKESRCQQYATISTKDLDQIIDERKKALNATLAKTAAKKAELANKKGKYHANHLAKMQEIETLTQVHLDVTKHLEHLRLGDALRNEEPSD